MIWYLFILALAIIISSVSKETGTLYYSNGEKDRISKISSIGFIIIILILILFEGFRSSTVGTDTGGYCRGFMLHTSMWWRMNLSNLSVVSEEPGLRFISIIADYFSSNYISFLTVASAVMVICALTAIRRTSIAFTSSLFVYISLAFYLFGFAGIRQAIALNIYLWGVRYILVNKPWKYVIIVLIAALFHKSIIVALPMYFICRAEYNMRNIAIIAIGAIVLGQMMNSLLDFGSSLENRYEYYTQTTSKGSGSLLTLFSVCLTIFYMSVRKIISKNRLQYYDKALYLLIIGTSIYLIVTITGSNTELNRFALYFQTGSIFLLPEFISAPARGKKNLLIYVIILAHICYYIAYVNLIGGISNYKLNPILFS